MVTAGHGLPPPWLPLMEQESGILTSDGVHPLDGGGRCGMLLANAHAKVGTGRLISWKVDTGRLIGWKGERQ